MGSGATLGPGAVIDQDVPCQQCGYNLRTLSLPGRCPECGAELGPSVREFALRRLEYLPPDPVWARQVRAGAGMALAALVLMLLPFYLPREMFQMPFRNAPLSRTPGRTGLLAIECVAWTLAWAAAWRLSSEEPFPDEPPRRGKIAVSLRWLSTAYLLVPFAWAWATWDTQYPSLAPAILFIVLHIAGLLGAFALMWRIGQILGRRGAWLVCLLAWLLAFVVPVVAGLLSLMPREFDRESDPSSLGLMLVLPMYPFGSAGLLGEILSNLLRVGYSWFWMFLTPPAIVVLLLVRIWFLYRAAALTPDE